MRAACRIAAILPELPVSKILPDLMRALESAGSAVLVAPPGAGKTTLVPLALLDAPWLGRGRRIVLLEPRRLAARAAARRMASLLGEQPGDTVGYAMRMENLVSDRTRILVVTEGVLARMILDDPELPGVARRDLRRIPRALARRGFRPGAGARRPGRHCGRTCRLLVMSATLDGARVSQAARRRAGHRERGAELSGRHPLPGQAAGEPGRGRRGRRHPRRAGRRNRQPAGLPARPARDRANRRAARRPRARRRRHRSALRHAGRPGAGHGDPAGAGRPPQDRAGDLHRRNLDHHRRRAGGHRFGPGAAAADTSRRAA